MYVGTSSYFRVLNGVCHRYVSHVSDPRHQDTDVSDDEDEREKTEDPNNSNKHNNSNSQEQKKHLKTVLAGIRVRVPMQGDIDSGYLFYSGYLGFFFSLSLSRSLSLYFYCVCDSLISTFIL